MHIKRITSYILFIGLTLLLFQNCGDYKFKSNSLSKSSTKETCTNTNECNNTEDNQTSNNNQDTSSNSDADSNSSGDTSQTEPNVEAFDFYDSFESADMNKTNNFGFYWEKNNRTSIVRDDQYAVWNNGAVLNGPVSNK